MTTLRPARLSNCTGNPFELRGEKVLVLTEGEHARSICLGASELDDSGRQQEPVILPVIVLREQAERHAALVGLSDAFEGLQKAVRTEELKKALRLPWVSEQVSASKDREQVLARHERRKAQEHEPALRAVGTPGGPLTLLQFEGAVTTGEDLVVLAVCSEPTGDPELPTAAEAATHSWGLPREALSKQALEFDALGPLVIDGSTVPAEVPVGRTRLIAEDDGVVSEGHCGQDSNERVHRSDGNVSIRRPSLVEAKEQRVQSPACRLERDARDIGRVFDRPVAVD